MFGVNDDLIIRVKAIVQSGKIAEKDIFFSSTEDVFNYMSQNDVKELFFYKEAIGGLECVSTEVFDELFKIGKGNGKSTGESVFVYGPHNVTFNDITYRVQSSIGYLSQKCQHYVVISVND